MQSLETMFSIVQQNLVYKVCKIEVSRRLPMGAFCLLVFFNRVFGRIDLISVIVPIIVDIYGTRSVLYERSRFLTHFCFGRCRVTALPS